MTEAWLLFDESAIRRAADRPMARDRLDLPVLQQIEDLADPKKRLHESLLAASGVRGRRRKRFKVDLPARVRRVAELIDDFSPLRRLKAYQQFELDCAAALKSLEFA